MIVGETFEDERVADLVVYSDTAMNLRSTVVSSKRRSKAWKAALRPSLRPRCESSFLERCLRSFPLEDTVFDRFYPSTGDLLVLRGEITTQEAWTLSAKGPERYVVCRRSVDKY